MSYRRTNEPGGLEVEPSTAGASGGRDLGRCGTYAGWNYHRRAGEAVCRPCLKARADYMAEYRKKGKCAPGLGWPL